MDKLADRVLTRFKATNDRTIAVVAGAAFTNHVRAIDMFLAKATTEVREMEGLLHYRLRGEGRVNDLTNKPTLTPQEERKAEEAWQTVKRMNDTLKAVGKMSDELERAARDLDSFMRYQ